MELALLLVAVLVLGGGSSKPAVKPPPPPGGDLGTAVGGFFAGALNAFSKYEQQQQAQPNGSNSSS